MRDCILVVDDEKDLLDGLRRTIEPEKDCRVLAAGSAREALAILKREPVDVVLADIRMPGMDGMALSRAIQLQDALITVILMTAYGTIEQAVEAIKEGAYDFIRKPFDEQDLMRLLRKALERNRLLRENVRLQEAVTRTGPLHKMIGTGLKMRQVFAAIQMLARSDVTVLLLGESGTGKEMAARAIHALSQRSGREMVVVNCPALPESILESELFGYRQGAFTNAARDRKGLFEEAIGSTILLDEIGDLSMGLQTKLLRVLQEKEIKPLGDARSIQVDVRILASTNQDLKAKIRRQEFREDFFYRLNVLPIHLPPLRERVEDIALLTNHFLEKHCTELNKPHKSVSPELMAIFKRRYWEGNIRELENIIIQGILFSPEEVIRPQDVGLQAGEKITASFDADLKGLPYKAAKEKNLQHFNDAYIGHLLTECDGNVSQAARLCGLERQALQQIMRRYGIKADSYREA